MKYYCNECEKMIDESDLIYDEEQRISLCPWCKLDDLEECSRCEMCGEYIEPDTIFCKDCAEDIKTTWENMIYGLSKERRAKYDDMQDMVLDWIEREVC